MWRIKDKVGRDALGVCICTYIYTKLSQSTHGQSLNKVLAKVLRMMLAFFIYLLPWLSSDNGPIRVSLNKCKSLRDGYHSNHFRQGCNVSNCTLTSSSEKYMPFKKLNIIKYWRANSVLKDPHSVCGKPPEAGRAALRHRPMTTTCCSVSSPRPPFPGPGSSSSAPEQPLLASSRIQFYSLKDNGSWPKKKANRILGNS